MPGGESLQHIALKQHALTWARAQGFAIAGVEISVPRLGCSRLDAAAARTVPIPRGGSALPPITAIFECKQSRADFLRDARCEATLTQRLARLQELQGLYEESMRTFFPTLRTGEGLFPEFDGFRFDQAGFEPYEAIVREIRTLTRRLHGQTKLGKLIRWNAANLCYLVVEPGVAKAHEVPAGWGLLLRTGAAVEIAQPATWHEVSAAHRWELLQRIALGNTRAVYRQLGIASLWQEKEALKRAEEPAAPPRSVGLQTDIVTAGGEHFQ